MKTISFLLALLTASVCQAAQDAAADELLNRALALASSARLEDAEELLLEGREAFAQDGRFPIELAGVAWRRNQLSRAKAYLRQGLRLDPPNAYANEFLGGLYLLDRNLYAALKYWNRVRRPVLSSIAFASPPPIRAELLERIPAVSAGQLLTIARLAQTERNLERLRVFTEPQFGLTPASNNEYELVVRSTVLFQPLTGVAGRVLPLLRGLPYQQVNFDVLNIKRQAISLTSLWRWDPDKRRIAIRYRAPLARGAFAVWTDFRDEDWNLNWRMESPRAFAVRSAALGGEIQFELGGGRQWTPSLHLSRHTFQRDAVPSGTVASQPEFANSTVWEVRNRFDFSGWRYPERRVQFDSSATLRTGRTFSQTSSRLVGAEFDGIARWFPQQQDDLYAVRGRVHAGALAGRLPVDELYQLAMERDNDLWLRGHAGTRNGKKGSAPMGTRVILAQTEFARRVLQIPFLRIDAGPFLDVGNIGGESTFGSRGWLYDAGAQAILTTLGGFRWSFIYGRDVRGGTDVWYTAFSR